MEKIIIEVRPLKEVEWREYNLSYNLSINDEFKASGVVKDIDGFMKAIKPYIEKLNPKVR